MINSAILISANMQVIERVSGYEEILILTGAFICINLWAIIKVAYKKYLSNIYIDLFKYSFQKSYVF